MRLLVTAISLVFVFGCSDSGDKNGVDKEHILTSTEMLAVAEKTVREAGCYTDNTVLSIDQGNRGWRTELDELARRDSSAARQLRQLLGNRKYQAIRCDNLDLLDGISWILIDPQTGEAILSVLL